MALQLLFSGGALHAAIKLLFLALASSAARIAYILLFHPLRNVPGPWWSAVTRIPYAMALRQGRAVPYLVRLHEQYGPIVRYTPNEISVTKGEVAWQEIYGFRVGKQKGKPAFDKDRNWYTPGVDGVDSILRAQDEQHTRLRRGFSHAFSDRALRDQEPTLQKFGDLLVSQISATDVANGKASDMDRWYTWTTSDVISELGFGTTLGSLGSVKTSSMVELMEGSLLAFKGVYILRNWPFVERVFKDYIVDTASMALRLAYQAHVKTTVTDRIEKGSSRSHDFLTDILAKKADDEAKGETAITNAEIISTSHILLTAGTDTTATALSSATYHALSNPEVYRKLVHEVRSTFSSADEITIERTTSSLPYTNAVLTEAMRVMPSVPAGFPRKVPAGGAEVCGVWLDGDCDASISMTHFASYRDEANFRDAKEFVPERWLGDERYEGDNRATFQPFNFGPRNCLGKNLAWAEMRLFLAKVVFSFDMRLADDAPGWPQRCEAYLLWHKPALNVHLTPVAAAAAAAAAHA